MKQLRPLTLLALSLAGTFAPAAAQQAPATSGEQRAEVLRQADRGDWYLRISARDHVVEGRVIDIEPELVRLAGGSARLDDVRRIERRHRSGRGAMVGAIVAGVALGALFYTAAAGLCDLDCDRVPLAMLAGLGLGGTVGGLAGALIAPGETWWEELWSGWP